MHDMQTLIFKKGVAILESSKVDVRAKKITTDKESYSIMIKWKEIQILNNYAPKTNLKCMKQKLMMLNKKVNKSRIVV